MRKIIFLAVLLGTIQSGFCTSGSIGSGAIVTILSGQDAVEPGPFGCLGDLSSTPGTFSITVQPALPYNLTVYLNRSGTASGPVNSYVDVCYILHDYALDPSYYVPPVCPVQDSTNALDHVVVPAGTTNYIVNIWPKLDAECEDTETVILTILDTAPSKDIAVLTNTAGINIYNTDTVMAIGPTMGTSGIVASIVEGQEAEMWSVRSCGCTPPKPLSAYQVNSEYCLVGDAVYGVDYTMSSVGLDAGFSVNTTITPPRLYVDIAISNVYSSFKMTTISNNAYGDKTVVIVPFCQYVIGNCYYGPTKTVTNGECVYQEGGYFPAFTIIHPTISPLLDSPSFQAPVFQFNVNGQPGAPYVVSISTNLTNWKDVVAFTMSGSVMQVLDLQATNATYQFYRVKVAETNIDSGGRFTIQTPPAAMRSLMTSSVVSQSKISKTSAKSLSKLNVSLEVLLPPVPTNPPTVFRKNKNNN